MGMQASSHSKFRSVFDDHFDDIRRYCLRRLPVAEANDAVSEVFMTTWRRIDKVPSGSDTRPWLFGVARNVVRNRTRAHRRADRLAVRVGSLAPPRDGGPELQVVVAAEHEAVIAAMDDLRDSDREILRLRLWEDMTVAQTAAILRISERAASKRYSRALARVAEELVGAGVAHSTAKSPEGGLP